MKLSTVIVFAAGFHSAFGEVVPVTDMTTAAGGCRRRKLNLMDRWEVLKQETTFMADTNTFKLKYQISNCIEEVNIVAKIYDEDCKAGDNEIFDGIVDKSVAVSNGEATLDFTFDPAVLSYNDKVYSMFDDGTSRGTMKLCVRFDIQTETYPFGTYNTVDFMETNLAVNFQFENGIDLLDGYDVSARDIVQTDVSNVYSVEAYLCDPTNPTVKIAITEENALQQGSLVSVCIAPDAAAIEDGVVMSNINTFKWTRDFIEQPAIENGEQATNPSLTTMSCEAGSSVCSFSSVLFAAFFATPGNVTGSGIASLQFDTARRLQDGHGRTLQDDTEGATSSLSEFDISIVIISKLGDDPPNVTPQFENRFGSAGGASILGFTSTTLVSTLCLVSAILLI